MKFTIQTLPLNQTLRNFCCRSKTGLWIAVIIGIITAVSVSDKSHANTFEGIAVEVSGRGPAMVFIPGLTSSGETFTETCAAFQKNYTCHLLHLPGFAGQPATSKAQAQFLHTMRDSIRAYIETAELEKPILVGHSLGGVLSLMLALQDSELASHLIIIDALPFYPAIQNPALTAEITQPQAKQMRDQMMSLSDEQYQSNAAMQLVGMSNNAARMPLLTEWSKTSDRATTSQAMYDMMTTDLRSELNKIKTPTLVLGAWAAYKGYGATRESTRAIFTSQYAALDGVDIRISDTGFHFLTWDDHLWVVDQIQQFLRANTLHKQ